MAGSVLVVDDNVTFVSELRHALGADGASIDSASDAVSATAMLDRNAYCGIVLDLMLASGPSVDLLQHIAERHARVPIVVVSDKLPSYVGQLLPDEQVKLFFPGETDVRTLRSVVLGLCGIPA